MNDICKDVTSIKNDWLSNSKKGLGYIIGMYNNEDVDLYYSKHNLSKWLIQLFGGYIYPNDNNEYDCIWYSFIDNKEHKVSFINVDNINDIDNLNDNDILLVNIINKDLKIKDILKKIISRKKYYNIDYIIIKFNNDLFDIYKFNK